MHESRLTCLVSGARWLRVTSEEGAMGSGGFGRVNHGSIDAIGAVHPSQLSTWRQDEESRQLPARSRLNRPRITITPDSFPKFASALIIPS